MKKNVRMILTFLAMIPVLWLCAQSVQISGPGVVEVGIPYSFRATFSPGGSADVFVESYTWSATHIGPGVGGPSNLFGSINQQFVREYTDWTSANTSVISITWGDAFNDIELDVVKVAVNYRMGLDLKTVVHTFNVSILRVCEPVLGGPSDIQACCRETFTFSANGCFADYFQWTVSGGNLASANGGSTILVRPDDQSPLQIHCRASRKTGLPNYYREITVRIPRTMPVTPEIPIPSFLCKGQTYDICLDQLCGSSGVSWNLPLGLDVLGGNGGSCIQVTPNQQIADGSTSIISAQSQFNGGCDATVSVDSFVSFSPEIPPVPVGEIRLLRMDDSNPCEPVYQVLWETNDPYENGITTTFPKVVLWKASKKFKVRVCNINLCSSERTCTEFWIDPPYPCEGDKPEKEPLLSEDMVLVNPNPSDGRFTVTFPYPVSAQIRLTSTEGAVHYHQLLENQESLVVDNPDGLKRGMYYLSVVMASQQVTKKIIIQ